MCIRIGGETYRDERHALVDSEVDALVLFRRIAQLRCDVGVQAAAINVVY